MTSFINSFVMSEIKFNSRGVMNNLARRYRETSSDMMREVMECDTDEICKALNVTTTNCWVLLHRARLSLRECLEMKWFGKK